MKVLLAHPGTQHAHQLALQLERQGLLYQFWTGLAFPKNGFLNFFLKRLPNRFYKKITSRIIDLPSSKLKTLPLLELKNLYQLRKKNGDQEALFHQRNKEFQLAIPDSVILASDVVIGFDTSAWILAERCKNMGKKFILDVSIAHPVSKSRVYEKIMSDYPAWSFALKQKPGQLVAIEQDEMEVADKIVVASSFSKDTLIENGVAIQKICVNPYGVDTNAFTPIPKKDVPKNFVFVGLVDARKGMPFLLDVWSGFVAENLTLTLIGPISEPIKKIIITQNPSVIIKGRLPSNELRTILPAYDVMIFPSYFEGFGLVIPEAMACGLPVITTDATCGPDIITNYKDGIVIEPGKKDALHSAISYFSKNSLGYEEMSRNARAKALLYNWNAYGERWKQILEN